MDLKEKLLKLKELTNQFQCNIKQYKSSIYDEANTRVDFIDKFFELLDWDVRNLQGFSEQYREVVREDKIQIEGKQKAPDYSFRIGKERKFFVEAKKPSVNIKDDISPAFQVRRYGYTAKVPLSILTDFEEFAVYDTRIKPDKNDKASVGRVFYCTFEEYEKHFDFIYNTFSKNAILKGSFDNYIEENKNKKGTGEVDKELLKLVEDWRTELAKNIALRNNDIDIYNLNNAVQKIIDRIIFLRIAEDKEIEPYEQLLKITKTGDIENKGLQPLVYQSLNELFVNANKKYNAGLFKPESWLTDIKIDDKALIYIIKGLYYPECPYEFSILPIEILGNIYEQFLGKTIRFRNVKDGHTAIIEEKPEVRKAGGVYYTPQYIVNYIVENTIGEKIKDKTPDEIAGNNGLKPVAILDPACGSGSFLVGAYQYLLNYHIDYYTTPPSQESKGLQPLVTQEQKEKWIKKWLKEEKIYQLSENNYKLTIEEKQKILINNIYGVDIDPQAVEVTKLSLYLKLLENEGKEAEGFLFKHSDIKLLPTLDKNIKCGNSLIGSDFYTSGARGCNPLFPDIDEMRKVNVFDWEKEFPEVFRKREKKVEPFHVTWVTHNSRVSERMVEYKVKTGESFIFTDEQEIKITEIIKNIVQEEKYKILDYNICKDHIHILLVCELSELSNIVKVIKGKSSVLFKKYLNIPNNEEFHLWAQKFDTREIKDDNRLSNTINYIESNRIKHQLSENKGLKPLVPLMLSSYDEAFDQYEPGGFDVVIGNPPYVKYENLDENSKNYAKNKFICANGSFDIFQLFLEKSFYIIKHKGVLGFIFPNLFLKGMNYKNSRKFFYENSKIEIIRNYGDGVFENVQMPTFVFIVKKENIKNSKLLFYVKGKNKFTELQLNQTGFNNENYIFELNDLSDKIRGKNRKLGEIVEITRGLEIGKDKISKEKTNREIIFGEDIGRYIIKNINFIEEEIYQSFKKNDEIFKQEKIIIRETGNRLTIAYDKSGLLTNRSLYCIRSRECNLFYLLGVLNSKLIQYFYVNQFKSDTDIFPKIRIGQVREIPIPIPNSASSASPRETSLHDRLVSLVDQMLETQKLSHNAKSESDKKIYAQKIEMIDNQIDRLVYELYGLTEDEIKVVEGEK